MAFLDNAGLSYFYSLIEAKIAEAKSSGGTVFVSSSSHTGDDATYMQVSIDESKLLSTRAIIWITTSVDGFEVSYINLVAPSGTGKAISFTADTTEDPAIMTICYTYEMTSSLVYDPSDNSKIIVSQTHSKCTSFTPYDVAFASLGLSDEDQARAWMRASGVSYNTVTVVICE